MQVFSCCVCMAGFLTVCLSLQAEAAKSRIKEPLPKCQTTDECQLSKQHYALYAFVKKALDSKLDLSGKELMPFMKSVDVLRKRYHGLDYNETRLIQDLLADERLNKAIELFKSDVGANLLELYRSSVNGKDQNLACSEFRLRALERATTLLDNNLDLATVFAKIHRNFAKKSAKRCLKHACTLVDTNMRELDSVLGRYQSKTNDDEYQVVDNDEKSIEGSNEIEPALTNTPKKSRREFEKEELELCRFLTKANGTDCSVSGSELKEISLLQSSNQLATANKSLVEDLMKTYYSNVLAARIEGKEKSLISNEQEQIQYASKSILQHSCNPLRRQLDYHLAALKYYESVGFLDKQKLSTRAFWCPSLSYWLQVERVCGELQLIESLNKAGI